MAVYPTRLHYSAEQIVWQEVPGEVTLAYTITGCPVGCKGCHSVDSWPVGSGSSLTQEHLAQQLQKYRGLITCVLFLGGEWQPTALLKLLKQIRNEGLETCLYTGYESVSISLREQLTYLKTGPWIAARGGLESPTTNQRFYDLRTLQLLNCEFQTGE
ncbi:anaerobic ribonucleoside-triphosphate reductase activating protein [Idiomarina sp. PL1-037]|uniref:anaerobic ribonucleoside-triphosphate reductase activating protein n=1 Tax=Idiomarina sp. PL1-037 TaxID=3095365 RepID=UPI002ACC09D3|nr:anaerobic ribonucleoside-triphosphate reductase activating protein [Idiomarina sp. PL1-037]WQC53173.1 anaerobic ribonucleoside-triphosphate reductase activating protein [Idiomarina sp. PL1-037]